MKLWLLKPVKNWNQWYDRVFGYVVRAASEDAARRLAQDAISPRMCVKGNDEWINPLLTRGGHE